MGVVRQSIETFYLVGERWRLESEGELECSYFSVCREGRQTRADWSNKVARL